jgi:XTP/dITP diphosphohydrolase
MKICLATNNQHKVNEFKNMLQNESFDVITLNELGCFEDIEETETTLEGNSKLKAMFIYEKYKVNCLADDSGLEVDVLGGKPGVYSARYAGEHGNHEKNCVKLLEELKSSENRNAQFRTIITLIIDGVVSQVEGVVRGEISELKRGSNGFGYDPIFIPDGYSKTFAEMTMEEKNPISHRGIALEKVIKLLK